MKPWPRRFLTRFAAAIGVSLALVVLLRVIGHVTIALTDAAFIAGGLAVVCLVGIAYGFRDARRIEQKRKAKEQIWLKH